jgi:hypothetical protein
MSSERSRSAMHDALALPLVSSYYMKADPDETTTNPIQTKPPSVDV